MIYLNENWKRLPTFKSNNQQQKNFFSYLKSYTEVLGKNKS